VRHQSQRLRRGRWVLAHLNYVSDDDLDLLRQGRERLSVAYCPIASAYFGHHGHRYRAMLDRGINVCLGTDSLACAGPLDPQPLGPLAAMRLLHRRDGTDSVTVLAMATVHGHRALCSPHADGSLRRPGALLACPYDPGDREPALTQVLRHEHPVTRVAG
jgi:cytosine/adenosine deaminase-related metal-dependent hydrolase